MRSSYEVDQNNLTPKEVTARAEHLRKEQLLKQGKPVGEAGRQLPSYKTLKKLADKISANDHHKGNTFDILY